MQTLTLSSNGRNGQLLDRKMSARLRAFRFLSDRFAQRDRSNYAVEFFLFVLIVLTAVSAMFSLAHAMSSLAHAMSLSR
jgi:Flp pilus assembly protein TadG